MTMTTQRERERAQAPTAGVIYYDPISPRPLFRDWSARTIRSVLHLHGKRARQAGWMRPAAARRRHTWRENQTSGHQPLQHAPVSGRSSIRGTNNEHAEARACGRDCRGAQGRDCPTVSKASEGRCRPSRCSALPTAQLASWMLSHLFYEIIEV